MNDRDFVVHDLLQTAYGDANLDGSFDRADLMQVLQYGKFDDAIAGNTGWAEGDWNGDGDFDRSDLILVLQEGSYAQAQRSATAAVPEPASIVLVLGGFLALGFLRKGSGSRSARSNH